MMKIVICDNDKSCCEELREAIHHAIFDDIEVSITCYEDGADLVKILENGEKVKVDLIFLDRMMSNVNGLDVAKILRKNQVEADIIFMTEEITYAVEGYAVHAYDFILKPISAQRVEDIMKRYYKEQCLNSGRYLLINKRTQKEWIPLRQVRYFLSDKRKIKAVLREPYETLEFYMKMEELEEKLCDRDFLRIHQSYLVNMDQVILWDRNSLVLTGNERIPVSRRYRDKIEKRLKKISI